MEASSLTQAVVARAKVVNWPWWRLPTGLRAYVGAVTLSGVGLTCYAASQTSWKQYDLLVFLLLVGCGMVSVAATPDTAYLQGGMTRDFLTVWVLPVSVLLPPFYAMLTPVPLQVLTQLRVHRGVLYRKAFSVAVMSLAYGAASVVFHWFPSSFAGEHIGTGVHALTWAAAVAICEQVGRRGHQIPIMGAIKLSNPSAQLISQELNRESLLADFAEFDLGVLITLVVAVNPLLALLAVPTTMLARRFMMHVPLVEQTRLDTKTGLLNAATWEREATAEVERAVRIGAPLAVALVDIDHFKRVNDTYGHLVGDKVLRAVVDGLRSQLRGYDLAGRFGGEEFIILLPQARDTDAHNVAERLRQYVASLEIPIDDEPDCAIFVRLTISVGVAALDGEQRELTDLMAAADAAMYYAKETGRNKTHVISARAAAS
jgi:diguanylate cyclase (GGDEF)-like protein